MKWYRVRTKLCVLFVQGTNATQVATIVRHRYFMVALSIIENHDE